MTVGSGNAISEFPSPNPFSVSHIEPGALPFLFASPQSEMECVQRWADAGFQGQIVGPHGSGKSTLAHYLAKQFPAMFGEIIMVTLRFRPWALSYLGETSFNRYIQTEQRASGGARQGNGSARRVYLVDGLERLSRWQRWALIRWVRDQGAGILVTTHESGKVGLPCIHEMKPSLDVCWNVVERLQHEAASQVTRADVERLFRQHNGNVRAVLGDLYDLWEQLTNDACKAGREMETPGSPAIAANAGTSR